MHPLLGKGFGKGSSNLPRFILKAPIDHSCIDCLIQPIELDERSDQSLVTTIYDSGGGVVAQETELDLKAERYQLLLLR
jgi:hypothetical protein